MRRTVYLFIGLATVVVLAVYIQHAREEDARAATALRRALDEQRRFDPVYERFLRDQDRQSATDPSD